MCQTCGDSPPDFFREERRRARIPHFCVECKEQIPKRARYLYIVQKDNASGEVLSSRLCLACEIDWELLEKAVSDSNRPLRLLFRAENEVPEHLGFITEALEEALSLGVFTRRHRLVRKWLSKKAVPVH